MAVMRFEMTYEAQQLSAHLVEHAKAKDYETVLTYEALSRVAGCNVQERRHILDTARRVAQREAGALFGVVAGTGIKLLEPTEQVAAGVDDVARIRRHAGRALNKARCVEYDKLSNTERVQHNMTASMLGAFRLISSKQASDKLEGAIKQTADKLPPKDMLKLFNGR
jgi:hypothetical protein